MAFCVPTMTVMTVALTAATPTRLVVGLRGADLRSLRAQQTVASVVERLGGVEVRRLPFAVVIDVPQEAAARAMLASMGKRVRWLQRDRRIRVRPRAAPDDPLYASQWHLHSTDETAPNTAIGAEQAWALSQGNGVVVAVVDDGFDLTHPDLRFSTIGLDLSDVPGDGDPSPGPGDPHGTQTAGVIGALGFNGIGVVGVCPGCEILPVRLIGDGGPPDLFGSDDLTIDESAAAMAIVWAVDQGAEVINNSWGPEDANPYDPDVASKLHQTSMAVQEALRYAARCGRRPAGVSCDEQPGLGAVVTWSAGNGAELATYDRYASDPRVIAVGAVDATGRLAFYSDFGPTVALVAPSSGDFSQPKIVTTDRIGPQGVSQDDYSTSYGGTSASAAMVAGVAALMLALHPELTAAQVREALLRGAFPIDPNRGHYDGSGRSHFYGSGRVDAWQTLRLLEEDPYIDGCTRGLEVCGNDIDDNCDGINDTDDPRCVLCIPDEPREICDGHDNDCDGEVDELFVCQQTDRPFCAPCRSTAQCTLGMRCRATTQFKGHWCFQECLDGQPCPSGTACDGEVCMLQNEERIVDCLDVLYCNVPERCDDTDNDCNGVVDDVAHDSLDATLAAEDCGIYGVCQNRGADCVDGAWQCKRAATWEQTESLTDGLDNDCDGSVDEHVIREPTTAAGRGCGALPPSGLAAVILSLLPAWMARRRQRKHTLWLCSGHARVPTKHAASRF